MASSLWVWKKLSECRTWRPSELQVAVKERVAELARMLGGQNNGARKQHGVGEFFCRLSIG